MEEKIKVAVAGFPSKLSMAVAQAICHSDDMQLFNHGLSESDFANRHLKIACVYMEMYNQERTPLFFEQLEKADVFIDCSVLVEEIYLAYYERLELPVIVLTSDSKKEIDEVLNEIRLSYQRDSCVKAM